MNPRLKARLFGLLLLVFAVLAVLNGLRRFDTLETTAGKYVWAGLNWAAAAAFTYGGLRYLVTGRTEPPTAESLTGGKP